MHKRITQRALAAALGISQPMVCKLAALGMPTDSIEAAMAWRAANLEPARMKGARVDTITGADARIVAIERLGELVERDQDPRLLEQLRAAIAALPARLEDAFALPLDVWDRLCGFSQSARALGEPPDVLQ